MPFAGLDIHKRVVEAVVITDDNGRVLHRERFGCNRAELESFAKKHLGPAVSVALEATTNTWAVVSVLEPLCKEVVVSNPLRTRAIAEAKVKTDKVDALVLAQLLRTDFLPRVWQPDAATQAKRRLCTRRASFVQDRTRIKNRIHAVLHQRLIAPPDADLFSKKSLLWLRGVAIDSAGRVAIDAELRLLEAIDKEILAVGQALVVDAYADPRVKLLMTLPGVDVAVAEILIASFGDITRFKTGDKAASYLGLCPSTRQSADHTYHGPITKQGRAHARWLLVQAAQHVGTHPGPLGVFFRRLAQKKGRNIAVVAVARKLAVIAWHMLTKNEPYRYAMPRTVEAKLSRLRVGATGQKRRGGGLKGAPRPDGYGKGGSRAVPSLDQACERESLPVTKPLAPGEAAMIAGRGLQGFVDQIHSPHRVPKPRKSKASSASTSDASAPPAPRAFETGTDRPGPSDSRSLDSSIKSNDAPS
jgi:transposase